MEKKICVFEGPVDTVSGYGKHAKDILKSLFKILDKDEWQIITYPTRWGSTQKGALDKIKDDYIIESFIKEKLTEKPDLHIQVTIPTEFRKHGKVSIGITAGTESDMCSADFVNGCNVMDLIIVPSKFTKKVLMESLWAKKDAVSMDTLENLKMEKPIEILFEGIDTEIYKKTKETDNEVSEELNKIKEDYCFLFTGHWLSGRMGHDRKDIGMLIFTFLNTFKNTENPPALILKTTLSTPGEIDKAEIKKRIKKIAKNFNVTSLPNIYVMHGNLSDEQMNSLYNHPKIKSMISFTHGEGFGRPLLEFSVTGKPIMVSNWSGHLDFIPNTNAVLLPGIIKKLDPSSVWDNILIKESSWFFVDYKVAEIKMKLMYETPGRFIEMARKQANNTNNFTLDKMTEKLKEILNKHKII